MEREPSPETREVSGRRLRSPEVAPGRAQRAPGAAPLFRAREGGAFKGPAVRGTWGGPLPQSIPGGHRGPLPSRAFGLLRVFPLPRFIPSRKVARTQGAWEIPDFFMPFRFG